MAKKKAAKTHKPATRRSRVARVAARSAQRSERPSGAGRRVAKRGYRSVSPEQLPRYAGVSSLLRLPVQPDIETMSASVENELLMLTMTFYEDVPTGDAESQFIVLYEFDLDQDPSTGAVIR